MARAKPTPTTPPTADAPLADQMRRDSAAARQALESFGLSPESYDALTARSLELQAQLRDAGAAHAADRLGRLASTVAHAVESPEADPQARGLAYLALLDSVLTQSIASEAPGPKWLRRLDLESKRLEAAPSAPELAAPTLALLTVASMCADIGAKVSPPPEGPIPIEWRGWRFGLVAAHAPDAASIALRAAAAVEALRDARMPGLVIIDLAQPVCPEQRPLRASHPDAGAAELRARLDRLLQDARPAIIAACDADHAIGVIGAAFLALHLVTANQVAFITAYRFMSLLEPFDPRERKLTEFRRRFGDL